MRVGDVQQRDVAEPRYAVERVSTRLTERLTGTEREPRGRRDGEKLEELATIHDRKSGRPKSETITCCSRWSAPGYLFTGEAGSISSATRSLIWLSVSAPA